MLLGPAGSGKTFRCVAEAQAALRRAPDGPPLIFIAPKQATFQIERQILADPGLAGYTRLKVLSFERLAQFLFQHFQKPMPRLVSDEGRVMVLRALLGKCQQQLRLFRSTARMPGFARQLGELLRELQQHQISIPRLRELSRQIGPTNRIDHKLADIALILEAYHDWLETHQLEDADRLLELAVENVEGAGARARAETEAGRSQVEQLNLFASGAPTLHSVAPGLRIEKLWLDGFGKLTAQERRMLAALAPVCDEAVMAFCVDSETATNSNWFTPWTIVEQTFRELSSQLAAIPGCEVAVEQLGRNPAKSRFQGAPALRHLEEHWAEPNALPLGDAGAGESPVRMVVCSNPEAEATFAAREILRYARQGGRFRQAAVIVRDLELYHDALQRAFLRYQIPCFLDRREPIAHHPLAELTRGALRTIAYHWQHADWFAVLKSGLVPATEAEIDWLENEALARGWEGKAWHAELKYVPGDLPADQLEQLRRRLVQPMLDLAAGLAPLPSGAQLTHALRALWERLNVPQTLSTWADGHGDAATGNPAVHATVWTAMNEWLDNVELAFAGEPLSLAQWISILEAGLAELSIGVVPPVLDQVLIGAVDRSRNPDLERVYVLGMNEGVFPAPPATPLLLTEADRLLLEKHGQAFGLSGRALLGQERFFAYIACTRARRQLVLTCALRTAEGRALNPSCFLTHLERLFPSLAQREKFVAHEDWAEAEHAAELIPTLLQARGAQAQGTEPGPAAAQLLELAHLPVFDRVLRRLDPLHTTSPEAKLAPGIPERLYGRVLKSSVSRLEHFAACPHRFFIDSGLRAEERLRYELDVRQQGSFQHDVLARFHETLKAEGRKWRELTPVEAQEKIGIIADKMMIEFQGGLLISSEQNKFLGRSYKESLQRFIGTIIEWMKQYQFDPEVVEIGFGIEGAPLKPWKLDLGNGNELEFCGRIDRVDLWRVPGSKHEALGVVIDYKSSHRKLKLDYVENGLHQQLPAYLNVLRHAENAQEVFGVTRIVPAGVFYVNLAGSFGSGSNRAEVLENLAEANRNAYQHQGIFDLDELRKFDNREEKQGDQFGYRLRQDGLPFQNCASVMPKAQFQGMLDRAESMLTQLGKRIYDGDVQVDPYKHGSDVACLKCEYQCICRIDPWTHAYRSLKGGSGLET